MLSPEVTVGIPVYNAGEQLRKAISSIQRQTWTGSLEILIYNDGSTDSTVDVVDSLMQEDSRIRLIGCSENKGRPYARNQLLEHAKGRFFAWLDSDDEWYPEKLDEQLKQLLTAFKLLGHTKVWCVCSCRIMKGSTKFSIYKPKIGGDQIKNLLQGTLRAYLQTTVGLTKTMQANQFDPRLPRLQDLDFFLNFAMSGGVFIGTAPEKELVVYNKEDSGQKSRAILASSKVIMSKHQPAYMSYGIKFYRREEARWACIAAGHAKVGKQYHLWAWLIIKSLTLSPKWAFKYIKKNLL